jgi:hypothetical protein
VNKFTGNNIGRPDGTTKKSTSNTIPCSAGGTTDIIILGFSPILNQHQTQYSAMSAARPIL